MEKNNVFVAEAPLNQLKPISVAYVANAHRKSSEREWVKVDAKWDTGATICFITKKLSENLGLKPESSMPVGSFTGSAECLYDVVALSFSQPTGSVEVLAAVVSELPHADCDIIVGMNLICQGEFTISTDFDEMKLKLRFKPYPDKFSPLN